MTSSPQTSEWKRNTWLGLLLLVVTFVVYQPAWRGAPVYDDTDHLTPPELQSVSGLTRIWMELGAVSQYYPITHSAFWVQHQLWGDAMLGYHVATLLLHVLAALLLVRILRQLEFPAPWLAAAIFALHPVMVESVAWISELKNTLSTVLYLGAALAYLRFDHMREKKFRAIALLLFTAGLLAKGVIASLPAALLVVFWWKRGKLSWKSDVLPLLPFFVIGIAMGLLTAWTERNFIGAQGEDFHFTLVERGLIAGRVVWFYLGKLLWPTNLIFIYPRWQISAVAAWQYLFPLMALALVVGMWALRHRSRGPLAAVLFFVGTLFPVLGFLNVYPFRYSFVADHFQYLASLGIIAAVAAGLARVLKWNRFAGVALCGVALTMLAIQSWRQSHQYRDDETLWRTTIERNPGCFLAYSNLSADLLLRSQVDEAIDLGQKALAIESRFAEPHNNLANALRQKGRLDEASLHYLEALRLRPDFAQAHCNLGYVLLEKNQIAEATDHFQAAVKSHPEFVKARIDLANALLQQGRTDDTITQLQLALKFSPNHPEAHSSLGNALRRKERSDEAIVHYRRALAIQPNLDLTHYNLGCVLLQKGAIDEAIVHFEKAAELQPDFANAHLNLAGLLFQKGRAADVLVHGRAALRLQPDNVGLLASLAWLMSTWPDATVRNGAEAERLALRANKLTGDRDPATLRALAAAQAENGHFTEAAATAQRALEFAAAHSDASLAADLREQLVRYRAGSPFRDAMPATASR